MENAVCKLKIPENVVSDLRKKHYGVFGHSAVQICTWTKKALTGKGVCYKERFYGADCHSCMEFSPVAMFCSQNCSFCWRPVEFMKNLSIDDGEVDEPQVIVENLIEERKKLLSGFGGNENLDEKKFELAQMPNHFAISLSGEPTLYPKLCEMVKYLKSLPSTKTVFVVSNGQEVDYFERLSKSEDFLPTQFYVSLDAPNEELYLKINRPRYKNGWERLRQSLSIFSQLETRKVIRITQIRGLNDLDEQLDGYKEMIEIGRPDFVEVKAYMHIGLSRGRHNKEQMPFFEDVLDFASRICGVLEGYEICDSAEDSRIVLLRRLDSNFSPKIYK